MRDFILHTIFLLIAAQMFVASVLPHHHHGEKICFVIEHCKFDGHMNDQHTNHTADEGEANDGCSLNQDKIASASHTSVPDLPVFLLLAFIFLTIPKLLPKLYGKDVILYGTIPINVLILKEWVSKVLGLRAPPAFG